MMLLAFNLASVTSVTSVSANAGTRRSISTNDGHGRGRGRGHDAHLDVDIDEDGRVHNMVHESTSKSPLAKLRRVLFHHQIQNHMHGNMNGNVNGNMNVNVNGNGSANKAGNGNRRYKHNHGQHSIMSTCRTRIMFALPTPEQLFDIMFASSSFDHHHHHGTQHPTSPSTSPSTSTSTSRSANSNSNSKGSVLQSKSKSQLQFNHDSVGMTKPPPMDVFMSSLSSDTSSSLSSSSTTTTTKNTCTMNIPSTTIGNTDTPTDADIVIDHDHDHDHDHTSTDSIDHTTLRVWWPSTSTSITSTRTCMDTDADAADKTTSTWRVKRYTRRVGVGRHCYNLVRDAALDWEFQSTSASASASASASSSTGNGDVDVDRMGRMNTGSMYRREATQMDAIRNVNTRYRSGDGNPIILERGTGTLSDTAFTDTDRLSDTDQGDPVPMPMPMPVTGIIRATPSRTISSSTQYQSQYQYQSSPITENTNPDILQIWSGIGTGPNYTATVNAHKKLATFTRFGFEFKLPLSLGSRLRSLRLPSIYLYAINPVAVVYDVVDERGDFNANGNVNVNVNTDNYGHRGFARGHGHAGCTYPSTAYATLQGHLLSGEERVSVILRHGENYRDGDGDGSHSNSKPGHAQSHAHAQSQDQDQDGFVDVEIISFSKAAPSLFGKIVWPFVAKKQDEFFKSEMDALERVAKKSCCVP